MKLRFLVRSQFQKRKEVGRVQLSMGALFRAQEQSLKSTLGSANSGQEWCHALLSSAAFLHCVRDPREVELWLPLNCDPIVSVVSYSDSLSSHLRSQAATNVTAIPRTNRSRTRFKAKNSTSCDPSPPVVHPLVGLRLLLLTAESVVQVGSVFHPTFMTHVS